MTDPRGRDSAAGAVVRRPRVLHLLPRPDGAGGAAATIERDLGLSDSEAQWVVNAFFLGLALFAASGGRLGDYYGHRQVLLVALPVFALGSLSAAVS